jgi:hypothetical protein
MARTDSERLTYYYELRDALEDAILTNGGAATTIMIRQRSVSYSDPIKMLEYVNRVISQLEDRSSPGANSRNRVRLNRF